MLRLRTLLLNLFICVSFKCLQSRTRSARAAGLGPYVDAAVADAAWRGVSTAFADAATCGVDDEDAAELRGVSTAFADAVPASLAAHLGFATAAVAGGALPLVFTDIRFDLA
jgi:hypothetical protein